MHSPVRLQHFTYAHSMTQSSTRLEDNVLVCMYDQRIQTDLRNLLKDTCPYIWFKRVVNKEVWRVLTGWRTEGVGSLRVNYIHL